MSKPTGLPQWRLPAGVSPGLWEYFQSQRIADDEDAYFAGHSLLQVDQHLAQDRLLAADHPSETRQPLVADLGCGSGRALLPLLRLGYRGLAIDLSQPLLDRVQRKASDLGLDVQCLCENLVELKSVATASVDHALCLFSTLGMIRGGEYRLQALGEARRILKPGGLLLLHAHNFWFNLYDPDGPWWVLRSLLQGCWSRDLDRGDRYYPYRGVQQMYLHVFTRRELAWLLRRAGFRIDEVIALAPGTHQRLKHPWFSSLRCSGWLIVSHATASR